MLGKKPKQGTGWGEERGRNLTQAVCKKSPRKFETRQELKWTTVLIKNRIRYCLKKRKSVPSFRPRLCPDEKSARGTLISAITQKRKSTGDLSARKRRSGKPGCPNHETTDGRRNWVHDCAVPPQRFCLKLKGLASTQARAELRQAH